ncbi:PepSY domain-containing protein [Streptomyces sp. NPDC057621]|uniref:PepSY domain-containing protein n=1 Tax=Streptomyces liliiviolaceus TaxID=2823109 RepID=A0A941BII4_9ACTN|nr:PepSY domain-containing protein [Streptomyces liliiviolaceus]MBQ0854939.1 PepSY domain-containing protein [Streptomyces liliiviolaceus]
MGSRRAGEIALSHVGGGTISEVEAETEHGRSVWSVKILKNGSRYEVHVDRGSGEITRSRTKSDDDHGGSDDDGRHGRHGRHHD